MPDAKFVGALIDDQESIGHDGTFAILDIAGTLVVADCPCQYAEKIQRLFTVEAANVAEYLRYIRKRTLEKAAALDGLDE
jgi:hypothetical protein